MSTATIEQSTATTAIEFDVSVVRFKKRQATGDWVLVGPASLVVEGPVTVTKKNGRTSVENVVGVGGTFDRNGVPSRYGYLMEKPEAQPAKSAGAGGATSEDDFVPDYEE